MDRDGTARPKPDSAVDATLQLNLLDAVGGYLQVGEILVGRAPRAYALGDVNADGRIDIAVARAGEQTVLVFLATRGGGLQQVSLLELDRAPCAMTMGEFDGGPSADVAVAFCSSDGVADDAWLILIGDGKGNLVPGTSSEFPLKLSVADLNQDGAEDIVALDASGAAQEFFFSNTEVGD